MGSRDKDIKEGFTGMDFTKKSQLFEEMPHYKSRNKGKVNTPNIANPAVTVEDPRKHAIDYLSSEHSHLTKDLNSSELNHVVSALVGYKTFIKK